MWLAPWTDCILHAFTQMYSYACGCMLVCWMCIWSVSVCVCLLSVPVCLCPSFILYYIVHACMYANISGVSDNVYTHIFMYMCIVCNGFYFPNLNSPPTLTFPISTSIHPPKFQHSNLVMWRYFCSCSVVNHKHRSKICKNDR